MPGNPVARPPLGGDREGLLCGFLGEVEIAEEADEGGQYPAPLAAEDVLDQNASSVGMSTSGRISIDPPRRTVGMRWVNSSTSSRSPASTT